MEQNATAAMPVMGSGKQNSGKGLKIATAIASVVAVCGIGFGVYGMIQSSQKDNQISDLKVQIKEDDGTVTTIETPEINTTTGDGTTITITDSAIAKTNPVIISSNVEGSIGDGYNDIYRLVVGDRIYSDDNFDKSWSLSSSEGDLVCQILDENSTVIDNCDISAHSGKVSNMYSVGIGNGIEDYILILTENGNIEYLSDTGDDYNVLKRLDLPKKVSQVYPNVSLVSVDASGNSLGSGLDALIVYSDGQIADFYDLIRK